MEPEGYKENRYWVAFEVVLKTFLILKDFGIFSGIEDYVVLVILR